jgi:2,4-dienoyl-CoA reductase-like NADH-dependent reductase (Old Yellow Enzyme family)
MASPLFEPFQLGKLTLRNRLVRSATHEGLGLPDGLPDAKLPPLLARLASGGVGLIISAHTAVLASGKASDYQLTFDQEACVEAWRPIVANVHECGGKIILQLAHAGGNARHAAIAAGPSPFTGASGAVCRELTLAEIAGIPAAFAAAAARAERAGFDGVQLHAGHGYLISEFLSPVYNHRGDAYGGAFENRVRLLLEVCDAVRGAVGPDFPILAKINSEDFFAGGFSVEESAAAAGLLAARGLAAIELSGGLPVSGPKLSPVRTVDVALPDDPVYYEAAARRIRAAIDIPVILVGGIRFPATAERLLRDGVCDLVSMCRPLIREPELPARWAAGDRRKADCISCNGCFRPAMTGRGLYCTADKREDATSKC